VQLTLSGQVRACVQLGGAAAATAACVTVPRVLSHRHSPPLQALGRHTPALIWQAVDARPDRTAAVEALLRLPPGAPAGTGGWHEVTLSLCYRAAFASVFDHPPDASRGVDVPPALATLLPPACAGGVQGGISSSSGMISRSSVRVSSEQPSPPLPPPLLRTLQRSCGAAQGYSGGGGGGVVPLPLPDFSMPFNVVCFTSTLLAVLLGGAANAMLRWVAGGYSGGGGLACMRRVERTAGGSFARSHPSCPFGPRASCRSPAQLAGGGDGGAPRWRRKLRRLAVLLVGMGGLAVFLDRDLQRQAEAAWHWWRHVALGRTRAPELHGEL
jgi:phosphatidylinositol glycan class T